MLPPFKEEVNTTNTNIEPEDEFYLTMNESLFILCIVVGLMLAGMIFIFYKEGKKRNTQVGIMPQKDKAK